MVHQGNTYLPPKSRELNSVPVYKQVRYLFLFNSNRG